MVLWNRSASNGSALIMVLWSLVLIGFLAGEYLDHNREKVGLAINVWNSLKQRESIDSVFHLFATDSWPMSGQDEGNGAWTVFSPGGIELWAKVESESNRININTAPDSQIRTRIHEIMGEGGIDEADPLADAILDWRDKDTLVRTNGVEAGFYESRGLSYVPANGPFKVLTELLLVKGVTPDLFWADPLADFLRGKEEERDLTTPGLLEAFTIYPKDVRRVSVLVPGKQNGYTLAIAFLEKKHGRWDILQLYRCMLVTSKEEMQLLVQLEAGIELS